MNWLKSLTLGICSLSVIYTVVKMLSPQKYQTQIKTVISLLFAILLGSMLLGFDASDISDSLSGIAYSYDITDEDKLVISEIESRISEYLQSELENIGINPQKVSIKTNIDADLCISISEARVVLEHEDENKSEAVRTLIAQKIGDIDTYIELSEE